MRILPLLLLSISTLALTACATQRPTTTASSTEGSTWVQKAYVTEVRDVTENDGRHSAAGSTVGSILGAVIGGVAGSNIGGGFGRAIAATGGAVAGGIAGQQAGRASSSKTSLRLTIRNDSGETSTYYAEPGETFRVGDEVKIVSRNGIVRIMH